MTMNLEDVNTVSDVHAYIQEWLTAAMDGACEQAEAYDAIIDIEATVQRWLMDQHEKTALLDMLYAVADLIDRVEF